MNTIVIVALIFRFLLIFVHLYLFLFFRKRLIESKASGFTNKFFVGYMIVFLILFLLQSLIASYELLQELIPNLYDLKDYFPGYLGHDSEDRVWIFFNMIRPLYVLFFISLILMLAALVYPLESIMEWNKLPITKTLVIIALLQIPVFIPVVTFTFYTVIVFSMVFLGVLLGIIVNLGINIKLYRSSTGSIQRRSLFAIIAFLLFFGGFAWSLELSWSEMIWAGFDRYEWDIIFGSILVIISTIFYRLGFAQEDI